MDISKIAAEYLNIKIEDIIHLIYNKETIIIYCETDTIADKYVIKTDIILSILRRKKLEKIYDINRNR